MVLRIGPALLLTALGRFSLIIQRGEVLSVFNDQRRLPLLAWVDLVALIVGRILLIRLNLIAFLLSLGCHLLLHVHVVFRKVPLLLLSHLKSLISSLICCLTILLRMHILTVVVS